MTTTAHQATIGWVGAGRMGLPMLGHLMKAGYRAQAYDTNAQRAELARQGGAALAATPGAAAAGADVVFSSLPNDVALLQAALADDGILAHCQPGSVYAEVSTVSLEASQQVAQRARERGVHYLRCPVSGNSRVAEAGELTVLASGEAQVYERVLPLLRCIGIRYFYLGDGEQARLMKLAINLMVSVTAGMMAEALTLGRSGGLDWRQMLDVMDASAVASPMVKVKTPPLRERDFTPTMTTVGQTKDVDLILDAGRNLGVPLALTAAMRQMFTATLSQGEAEQDYIAVVKMLERSAGLSNELG